MQDVNPEDTTEDSSQDATEQATESGVLPKADNEVLLAASAKYNELLQANSDEAAARQSLVAWLNDQGGVISGAGLFEDGYTVIIRFQDGHWGGVFTLDPQSIVGTPPDPLAASARFAAKSLNLLPAPTSDPVPAAVPSVPGQKKVLFMDIAHPDFPFADPVWQSVVDRLTQLGWSAEDIVHVERKDDNDLSVTPDTWFQLGDYGFVVTLAHGLYGKLAVLKEGTEELPNADVTRGYLQCCSAGNFKPLVGEEKVKLWMKWNTQADVFQIVNKAGATYLYISTDMLRNQLPHLDKTILYLMTCFGWHHRYAYLENGASAVLGWDNVTQIWDALMNLQILTNRMFFGSYETLGQVYDDGAFVMKSVGLDTEADLHLSPDSAAVTLPAWIQISLFSDKSYEGALVQLSVDYTDAAAEDLTGIPMGGWPFPLIYQASGLIPGMSILTVKAVDPVSGAVLAWVSTSQMLHPGQNPPVSLNLDAPHPLPYQILMSEPYVAADTYTHWHWVLEWGTYPGALWYAIQGHTDGWQVMGQVDPWWEELGTISAETSPDLAPFVEQMANGKRYKVLRLQSVAPENVAQIPALIDDINAKFDKCTFTITAMCQNGQGAPMVCP